MQDQVLQTDWFFQSRWGVMCHYLASPPADAPKYKLSAEDWNARVDAFDVKGLADQLEAMGAGYIILTLGQNSGHFCSPNATYDSFVPSRPSKCSRRDLPKDLAVELAPRGIRTLAYVCSSAPYFDPVAREGLEWEDGWVITVPQEIPPRRTGKRLAEFQRKWEAVIREWSLRWGELVSGWWVDACYFADEMYRHPEPPNFQSLTAAFKAGNPQSIVAYNPGILNPVICHTEYEDYTAGEVNDALPVTGYGSVDPDHPGRWVEREGHKAQYHVLSYLGETWGKGQPRFPDELAVGYTRHVNRREGVVTWDVPLTSGGLISEPFLRQLNEIGRAVSRDKKSS